jgi:hypothetical protein
MHFGKLAVLSIAFLAPYLVGCGSSMEDGLYIYKSRVVKGEEKCKVNDGKCVSLSEYKTLCSKVSSLTNGMGNRVHAIHSSGAFSALLKGGGLESVKGEWLGEERFKKDSKILGACEVEIVVSGLYKGTSSREVLKIYAEEFVVSKGEVLLHSGSSSAWML